MWYHRTCSHPSRLHANVTRSRQEIECLPREMDPLPRQEPIGSWPGWVRDISPWLFIKVPPSRTLIWSRLPLQKRAIQSSFIRLQLFMALYYQCMVTPKSRLDFRLYLAFDLCSSTQPATTGHRCPTYISTLFEQPAIKYKLRNHDFTIPRFKAVSF